MNRMLKALWEEIGVVKRQVVSSAVFMKSVPSIVNTMDDSDYVISLSLKSMTCMGG